MKHLRIITTLALTVILCASSVPAQQSSRKAYKPGGMWMPHQIAKTHGNTLKKMGLELDPEVFSDPLQFPLNAIVGIGASASFVSPDGLVATNHHCVRGALQYNSTPKQNLLQDGYVARSRSEELYAGPTSRVYVTTAVTDVTEPMLKGLKAINDDQKRYKELEQRKKDIVARYESRDPNVRCRLAEFYGGLQYYLITQLEIRDVRLVYAPHEGVGYFGGDEDNWMWPRQCGDFALLRAYVGPDGKPAEYSKRNVPFKPKAHLKLAPDGVKEGDLVFVVGYPGSTARLVTAGEIEDRVKWEYPARIDLYQKHIDTLHQVADGDPELYIKAVGSIFGLENGKKNRQGILQCAKTQNIVERKYQEEKSLMEWIDSEQHGMSYGPDIRDLNALLEKERSTRETDRAFELITPRSSLLSSAVTIVRMAEERVKPDSEREEGYQKRDWKKLEQTQEQMEKTYDDRIESAVFALYLKEACSIPSDLRPKILNDIFGTDKVTDRMVQRQVAAWLKGTRLQNTQHRIKLLQTATQEELQRSQDTYIQLALQLRPYQKNRQDRDERRAGKMILLRPAYSQAMLDMKNGNVAPDANGTIRVSFGTVRGFRSTPDAPLYKPFTNVWQMVEKWAQHRGEHPFNAPERIISAVAARRFGPYETKEAGGVPVDFLTDLDITGGNSGSATLNAKGELVGFAFDGNIEGVGSDLLFQDATTRAIHADVRYFKWMLDAVDGADHLLREMGVEPKIAN